MTAAVLRSSPNLAIPQTQNTAPVYEFNCLYTHDLRRKQKRWQDGFLRYHTFNKRVMVYDVPRNFLGDIHWTHGEELQEGDEMTLDKGAIMVQVAERVGRTETDISGLVQRKDKTPAKPTPGSAVSLRHRTPHSVTSSLISRPNFSTVQAQGKHKSLTALLGNSRRPIGKASVPVESPFDLRQQAPENAGWESGRDPKRRKTDTYGPEATTTPTAKPAQKAATVSSKKSTTLPILKPRRVPDVIDISSDTEDPLQTYRSDNIEAELLSTSSPNHLDSPAIQPVTQSVPRHRSDFRTIESPSIRIQQRTRASPPPAPVPVPVIAPPERRASTPRDVRPMETNKPVGESRTLQKSASYSSESDPQKRGKSLKLVGGAPRKMLVIQSRVPRGSSSAAEPDRGRSQETLLEKDLLSAREASKPDQRPVETTYRRRMQERLAQLAKKQRMALSGGTSDEVEQISDGDTAVEAAPKKRKSSEPAHPKAPAPARIRKTPVVDVPLLNDPHVDLEVAITEPILAQQDSLPRPKPLLRDMYANPKARNMLPPIETAIMHRPFKPPGAKEAAPDNEPKDSNDGKAIEDLGPWSKEAFDLMDWRPPDRDANGVKITTTV